MTTVGRARRRAWGVVAVLVLGLVPMGVWMPAGTAGPGGKPSKDPCGITVAKPTGGSWQCTFADSFGGRSLDTSKWVPVQTAVNGFSSGGECYTGSRNNVSVGDGVLTLTVRQEAQPFTCSSPRGDFETQVTGGYVTTWSTFAQAYGRFEVRAAFPATTVPGVHSALWLWPVDAAKYGSWPASGEIDIAEFYSAYPDRVVPYVHYSRDKEDPNATNTGCMVARPEDFHTYLLEWTPQTLTISYDGNVCIVDDWLTTEGLPETAPFDQPFHLNLTQALGIMANRYDASSTPLPATMRVDHVKVWR